MSELPLSGLVVLDVSSFIAAPAAAVALADFGADVIKIEPPHEGDPHRNSFRNASYPQSDKIGDAAYQLGDLYEGRAYKQYRRSAQYFERSSQWVKSTPNDGRLRAARIYDRYLMDRGRAMELYKEIKTHDTDPKRLAEAEKRLQELSGSK